MSRPGPRRRVLRWLARAALLLLLLLLVQQQALDYMAEPVSTAVVRGQAPFPALTLCPGAASSPLKLLIPRLRQLATGLINVSQLYDETTLDMIHSETLNQLAIAGDGLTESLHGREYTNYVNDGADGPLGVWSEHYHATLRQVVSATRCTTFTAGAETMARQGATISAQLFLTVSDDFTQTTDVNLRWNPVAYRLFVHAPGEEPNVGDLVRVGTSVPPTTTFREIRPGHVHGFRVRARMQRLVSLRRR
ncbi:MAG: hypothetical protein AAGF86_20795, partial [Pseudomonadota bacterium]